MDTIKKYLIGATILLFCIATIFIYLYFKKTDITYNPLDNPEIIKVLKQDSTERAQMKKSIDSIGSLYSGTQNSIDSMRGAVEKKLNNLNTLFIVWKSEKGRISKLTEKELEEEINRILDESVN